MMEFHSKNETKFFDFLRQGLMAFSLYFIRPSLIEIGIAQQEGIEELEIELLENIYYPNFGDSWDLNLANSESQDYRDFPKVLMAAKGSRWKLNIRELDVNAEPLCYLCDREVQEAFFYLLVASFFAGIERILGIVIEGQECSNDSQFCFTEMPFWISWVSHRESEGSDLFESWKRRKIHDVPSPRTFLKYFGGREEVYFSETGIVQGILGHIFMNFSSVNVQKPFTRVYNCMRRDLFLLAGFLTKKAQESMRGVCRVGYLLDQASNKPPGQASWIDLFSVPYHGKDKNNSETGLFILREDLPEVAAGAWELFLKFVEKDIYFFNYLASEDEAEQQKFHKKRYNQVMKEKGKTDFLDYDESRIRPFVFVDRPSEKDTIEYDLSWLTPFIQELHRDESDTGITGYHQRILAAGLDYIGCRAEGTFSERIVRIAADRVYDTLDKDGASTAIGASFNRYIFVQKQRYEVTEGIVELSDSSQSS